MKTMLTILSVSLTMATMAFATPSHIYCCKRCPCNGGKHSVNFASQGCDCTPDSHGDCTCESA